MPQPEKVRLPTPDMPSSLTFKQVLLTVPANADLERYIWGALAGIAFWTAWDLSGTMTQEEAAQLIKGVLASRMEFSMIGSIVMGVWEDIPSSMLLCDGGVYNKVDYPELWESWPSAMKDATSLTLPNMTDRFPLVASGTNPVGTIGGEAEVTLDESEIPAHTHVYYSPTYNIDVEAPGVPDPTGVGQPQLPETTGSTGGGMPHNNMPPFYALQFCVIAKVQP